nr:hypothetical protein [Euryarchaeota archaeon]
MTLAERRLYLSLNNGSRVSIGVINLAKKQPVQIEDIVKCPECNSRSLDHDQTRGETVCQDCGLVI